MNRWKDASPEQKQQAQKELLSLGLDRWQVASLMKHFARGGQIGPLDIELMVKLPANDLSGRKPTINVVRSIIHDMQTLGLVEKTGPDGKVIPVRTRGGFLRNKPNVVMNALCGTQPKPRKCSWCKKKDAEWIPTHWGGRVNEIALCTECRKSNQTSKVPYIGAWREIKTGRISVDFLG